jgi:histidinol-phosphate aminotransferase
MSRFFDLVSKPVREMGDSSNPKPAAAEPSARIIRLDSNENPYGPSPNAIEAIRAALPSFHAYPDNDCSELRRRLAAHHGMATDQVLVGAGSSELISLLSFTMLGPGLNAVTSERSFIVYGMAVRAAGAQLTEVPMKEDAINLDAILNAIDENTRIVFLANPNNPTGTKVEVQQLDKFLNDVPAHVVVALDEAYFEFAQFFAVERSTEYSRALDYVRQGKSVIVLRTFSKVHGLAGLRIGYGIGPSELLAYCSRMQSTFSVSSVAQAAAVAALDDQMHIAHTVSENAEQARVVSTRLMEFGYRVVPTWANFVYCDIGEDAAEFANRVLAEGVSIRPLAAWGAPNRIRVSIGTPEQNEVFLNAVSKLKTAP